MVLPVFLLRVFNEKLATMASSVQTESIKGFQCMRSVKHRQWLGSWIVG